MSYNALTLSVLLWLLAIPGVSAVIRYVDTNNPAPTPPYTNWSAAANSIQDAIDAANPGDLVLVTNGLYQTGGAKVNEYFTNRVAATKPLTIQSVNGPAATTIMGSRGNPSLGIPYVRCAYLTNGAALIGFTLTNGGVPSGSYVGGGAFSLGRPPITPASVVNCILIGNSAGTEGGGACGVFLDSCILTGNSAVTGGGAAACGLNNCTIYSNTASGGGTWPSDDGSGGGAYRCDMTNCLVIDNSASQAGGGVCGGWLNNCTVASNTAHSGGGVSLPASGAAYVTNSVVFYNSATTGLNYQAGPFFSYCCTTPLPAGAGNFTNEPGFLNLDAGDFHLQTNSPCINAGLNSAVAGPIDLDGNPRISGGAVDLGAYEFPNPASIISYAWLQHYGLPTDGSADSLDSDGDGMNNWQEWRAGTDPTNRLSVLRVSTMSTTGAVATVRWQSASNVTYALERSTNLLAQPAFLPVQTNIPGTGNTVACPDTSLPAIGPAFYRLRVE
jgi:hypothetical protein